jgi:hypothetical protein
MKTLFIALMMGLSATAFAANKDQSCNAYMNAASGRTLPKVRIELGTKAAIIASEFRVTPAQETKIQSGVASYVAQNPQKQNEFEKMVYFACTNDLDADEKAQIEDLLKTLGQL